MRNIQFSLIEAMREIAKIGIAKTATANLGGANVRYRGIEQAMNEMSLILIRCGITVTPDYSDLSIQERAKGDPKDGKAMRFATVKGAFTFAAEDGTSVKAVCYGEAMDSGDKAITKAQSVAFRTALFQQFVVPTMAMDPEEGGDGGADDLLDSWQATALEGLTKLQHRFTTEKPAADFWAKHSGSLKQAAMAADGAR